MKAYYGNYLLLTLMCMITQIVMGQNLAEDLKQIHQVYENVENLRARIVTKEYSGEGEPETESYTVLKQGTSFLYKIENTVTLMNDEYLLSINHDNKEIICTRQYSNDPNEKVEAQKFVPNLDSLVKLYETVRYLGVENGQKSYELEKEGSMISKVRFSIDTKSYLITNMVYHYNEDYVVGGKTELSFTTFDTKPVFKSGTFSSSKYIKQEGGSLVLTAAYKDYRLIITR